jgi:hypothetical protein
MYAAPRQETERATWILERTHIAAIRAAIAEMTALCVLRDVPVTTSPGG